MISPTTYTLTTAIVFIIVSCAVIYYIMRSKIQSKIIQYKSSDGEQLFLEFTENIHQVLWRMTVSTNEITYLSSYAEKIFGQRVDLIKKDPHGWLSFVIPEDRSKIWDAIDKTKQGARIITIDIKVLRGDGVIAVVSNQLFPSMDEQGNVIAVLGIISDMTAQYNTALQKRLRTELHKNLSQTQDMKVFSQRTLQSICLAIGYEIGEFWIFDDKENTLACLVHWSRDELHVTFNNKKIVVISEKIKNSFQIICFKLGIIQYSTHYSHFNKIHVVAQGKPIKLKEVVGVPIVVSNRKLGVLCFYNRHTLNLDIDGYKIISELAEEFGEYIQHMLLNDQLKYMTDYDVLTGLHNQCSFMNKISELIEQKTKSMIIITLRVNNYQLINYALGYDVGNQVHQEISKKFVESSSSLIDMVALTEPGVFGFLSHQLEDNKSIIDFVNKLLEIIKKPIKKNNLDIFLTASIGISSYPQNGTTPSKLLSSANLALIESLKEGSNQYKFATVDTIKQSSHVIEIENAMHHALKHNELELYYQPKVSLKTGKITGVEGLIRWHDPKNIIRLPEYFIPICEESDLILEINDWVLSTAINDIARSEIPIKTSLNLSARQFSSSYSLLERLNQLMTAAEVNYQYLELEVTETILMINKQRVSQCIMELKQLGITVSLDDFGTGYSSFAYLKNFAPDVIKIDKSFIDGLPDDVGSIKIVNAIISVSHSLGVSVIAEGVETAAQVKFLINACCDEIQGYYFSKPKTFSEVQAMIKHDKSLRFPE
ncbi:GGDEF domain-containing phosphodiesterase [Legionella bononiensis]|uniref:EAL domain-containing protein n=1 Tax=Legionella bononiensis TaxID=2793102 RepID=A0ABS1WAK5_9GAMM|nr:GGDEF domain-containing phosphodiesterase [Legionella bononiensis]MBL7480386.1 EAL domain-containing protein [Legionella bononiensis]MBL7526382.1 EAL domain-containing protein [Legionella bononiensis]MBL7563124.1 EAL domain-containing protein [Legionella bononiensis]